MSSDFADRFSVAGTTAIVTGASSGIGRAIAEEFAADGSSVVVCSREQANVEPVAEGIREQEEWGDALGVECDVTDREAVEALVEATVEEFGGLDVLVFVATPGLASQMGISADDVDREDVERRVGTSEEIADIARFLASDAASFIVGETVTAAGVPDVLESPNV